MVAQTEANSMPPQNDDLHDVGKHAEVLLVAGVWCFCSIGMTVFNKLAVHAFPLSCVLVAIQMAFTVLCMVCFCWKSLHVGSWYDVLRWSAVAPLFSGVLLTSMFALESAPMSLVIVFRGLAPLFSLAAEAFYPTPLKVTRSTVASLLAMLFGVVLYSVDLERNRGHFAAIGWVLLNNVFVVSDRLLQRLLLAKDQWPVDMSKSALTLMNNVVGIVPILLAAWYYGQYAGLPAAAAALTTSGGLWVALSCVVGVVIAYAGIWTQILLNATSFLVLATATKFVVILIEVFFMRTTTGLTNLQIAGSALTIVAGVAYGRTRERFEQEEKLLQQPGFAGPRVYETTPILDKKSQV